MLERRNCQEILLLPTANRRRTSVVDWMSKLGEKAGGFREHVTLGPKISETMKGKLSKGARIVQAGGVERVFRQAFSIVPGEKLLQAFQCLSFNHSWSHPGHAFHFH
ncbi:unnamed protein product [Musa acuminata subsp. malaccensis]|uniref:(wild Malaysian banana) hypothetical protein n=1 Tax=Musa acuminata subsp. malaccensis TaxID=214687 RepID=A0A8D7A8F2_MUSAM|nr:unnamed protein product [Musa acuminata subsp. malaccensis]